MNRFKTILCTKKEAINLIQNLALTLLWYPDDFYKVIYNDEVVALISYYKDEEYKDYYFIENFEVLSKGKKIGTKYITYLQNNNIKMCLYSISKRSNNFWKKLGFVLENNGIECGYYFPKLQY